MPEAPIPTLASLRRKSPAQKAPTLFDAAPPEQPTTEKVLTVSQLVAQVRGLVERTLGAVTVEGEISNWRPAASGHCYFTLKDGDAQLSIVIFRRQASLLGFQPRDGDQVRLRGQLSIYEPRGQLQLIADTMEQQGFGALLAAVQALKRKLAAEGLFDNKRPLPAFPRCIGVVTSLQGAALRDIVKVCRRRHASVNLLIYPAAVQGPNCPTEIAAGLRWFSNHAQSRVPHVSPLRHERTTDDISPASVDVILIARGGGSWEDLHGFDSELVVRAIAASPVPVVSAIGHATDSVLADAAADLCAPTPSAAAELLTAGQHRIAERVELLANRITRAGRFQLLQVRQRLSRLSAESVLRRTRDDLNRRSQRLDQADFRADSALRRNLLRRSQRLTQADAALRALSPLRVLERGYALVFGPDGKVLLSAEAVTPGDPITAQLHHGRLSANVTRRQS
jgi:exodeoxyribonuclease VII large subunit